MYVDVFLKLFKIIMCHLWYHRRGISTHSEIVPVVEQSFIHEIEDIESRSLEIIKNLLRSQWPRKMGGGSAQDSDCSWKLDSQMGNLPSRMSGILCRHIRCQKDSCYTLPTAGGTEAWSLVFAKLCNREKNKNKKTESRWKLLEKATTDREKIKGNLMY